GVAVYVRREVVHADQPEVLYHRAVGRLVVAGRVAPRAHRRRAVALPHERLGQALADDLVADGHRGRVPPHVGEAQVVVQLVYGAVADLADVVVGRPHGHRQVPGEAADAEVPAGGADEELVGRVAQQHHHVQLGGGGDAGGRVQLVRRGFGQATFDL